MKKEKMDEINISAFISVVLAGVLLGFIVHEIFHLLVIHDVSTLTLRFGAVKNIISVCCLGEGESAMEELAYFIQFAVTIGWVIINSKVFLQSEK